MNAVWIKVRFSPSVPSAQKSFAGEPTILLWILATNERTNATIYAIAHGPAPTGWDPSVPLELWEHHGEYGVSVLLEPCVDPPRLRPEFECRI
jgi:hypothetical protein